MGGIMGIMMGIMGTLPYSGIMGILLILQEIGKCP
jgi:hypothetical protein